MRNEWRVGRYTRTTLSLSAPPIDKQAVVYQFGVGGMCVQVTELVYGVPFPLMMMWILVYVRAEEGSALHALNSDGAGGVETKETSAQAGRDMCEEL